MNTQQYVDLVLNNDTGGTVSVVEVKAYPRLSNSLREETINQLESYSKRLDQKPLRYFTILSTATGYVKDVKLNKEIEFDTSPILDVYLNKEEKRNISPRLLGSVFQNWLRDLSFGLRKPLTEPEKRLEQFGFIANIKKTSPWTEYSIK